MESLLHLLSSFINFKGSKTYERLSLLILIIFILAIINNIIGYTYYYNLDKKLSLIEKIDNIQTNLKDQERRIQLSTLRNEILERKNVFYKVYSSVQLDQILKFDSTEQKISQARYPIAFHLTAGGMYYILSIIIIPIAIVSYTNVSVYQRVVIGIVLLVVTLNFGYILSFLCSIIPTTRLDFRLDYLMNLCVQILFTYFLVVLGKNRKKIEEPEPT